MIEHEHRSVEFFAKAIGKEWRKSAEATLEAARLAYEAYRKLKAKDYIRLALALHNSVGTLSKLRRIDGFRDRLKNHIADIPAAWTVMYDLCRLTERQFQSLVDFKKLRPDLTSVDNARFVSNSKSSGDEDRNGSRIIATIRTSDEIDPKTLERLRASIPKALKPALKGVVAEVVFPERKSDRKAKARRALKEKLADELGKRLAWHNRATPLEYDRLANAAWQHEHRKQKESYPYDQNNKQSIEDAEHPYSIKKASFSDRTKFIAYLRRKKIFTPHNPIPNGPDFAEEKLHQVGASILRRERVEGEKGRQEETRENGGRPNHFCGYRKEIFEHDRGSRCIVIPIWWKEHPIVGLDINKTFHEVRTMSNPRFQEWTEDVRQFLGRWSAHDIPSHNGTPLEAVESELRKLSLHSTENMFRRDEKTSCKDVIAPDGHYGSFLRCMFPNMELSGDGNYNGVSMRDLLADPRFAERWSHQLDRNVKRDSLYVFSSVVKNGQPLALGAGDGREWIRLVRQRDDDGLAFWAEAVASPPGPIELAISPTQLDSLRRSGAIAANQIVNVIGSSAKSYRLRTYYRSDRIFPTYFKIMRKSIVMAGSNFPPLVAKCL